VDDPAFGVDVAEVFASTFAANAGTDIGNVTEACGLCGFDGIECWIGEFGGGGGAGQVDGPFDRFGHQHVRCRRRLRVFWVK
jgi:hypothetical protein